MEKRSKILSIQLLLVVFVAQLCSFICLAFLKYNMDIVSVNYRNMEAKSYTVMSNLEEMSGKLYEHQNLVTRYIISEDTTNIKSYEDQALELDEEIRNLMVETDATLDYLDDMIDDGEVENTFDYVNAYLNCSDIAFEIRDYSSRDLAIYVLNNNMSTYVDNSNSLITSLRDKAISNQKNTEASMLSAIEGARNTFYIGVILCFLTTIAALWHCKQLLDMHHQLIYEADAANRAKSAFLSSMSHEIRTPINAVIGLNEMITRSTKDEVILNYAGKIKSASKSLLSLINDILDFSKIEVGKMDIVPIDYEFKKSMVEVWDLLYERAVNKGLNLSFEIDKNIPSELVGDVYKIKQIVTNILTNAVKYTNEGSVILRVDFDRINDETVSFKFAVEDTGIGIKPNDIENLTAAFSRVDQKKNAGIEGTGLGLSIVSRLLDLMNSQLKVYSVYGEGSTFSFEIVQKVTSWEPIGVFDPTEIMVDEDVKTDRLYAPKARVLGVDDNEVNRLVLDELLKQTGVKLTLAGGGQEAVDICKEEEFDLILMDHRMPGVNGVEAFHMIEAEGKNTDTPVVIVTANSTGDSEAFYNGEGFSAIVKKPIDSLELEMVMARLLPEELLEEPPEELMEETTPEAEKTPGEDSGEIDYAAGVKAAGTKSLYEKIVKEFVLSADKNIEKISMLKETGDIENYTIEVHALKSSARLCGANSLSEEAKGLEAAGDANDIERIENETEGLLSHYQKVVFELKEKYEIGMEEAKPSIDEATLTELLDAIAESVEAFDFDTVDLAVEKLESYSLGKLDKYKGELHQAAFELNQDKLVELVNIMKGAEK